MSDQRVRPTKRGLVDAKEIQIAKDGRGVFLFHDASAGAARIVAFNFATDLHEDLASAGEIRSLAFMSMTEPPHGSLVNREVVRGA